MLTIFMARQSIRELKANTEGLFGGLGHRNIGIGCRYGCNASHRLENETIQQPLWAEMKVISMPLWSAVHDR